MDDRKVTAVRGKFVTAWTGEEGQLVPACPVVELRRALEQVWAGDVYLCGYAPSEGTAYRRLAKVAATAYEMDPELPQRPALHVAFVDMDCPGHGASTDEWVSEQLARVPADIRATCGWYRTAHGMRLVVLPPEPLELGLANSYLRQLHDALSKAGCAIDNTSPQWTRLMRAPRSNNLDLPRDFSKLAITAWRPPLPLDREDAGAYGEIITRQLGDWPAPQVRPSKAELEPLAKRNKQLAADLNAGRFVVPTGERHGALLRAAADIVAAFDTADPGVPYALLAEPFRQMGKDDPAELRRLCEWACASHAGRKKQATAARRELTAASAATIGCGLMDVRRRLVVDAGANQWVWSESEQRYVGPLTHQHQLKAMLAQHCPNLAGGYAAPGSPLEAIYMDCSVQVGKVVYVYDPKEAGLDLSTTPATYRHCAVQVCDDLSPVYDPAIDRWLRKLFARETDKALDWLAVFPDLSKPICALYVDGPPSVGKGMLATGLARLWSKEMRFTEYNALSGDFQGELAECPLIYADEKVESKRTGDHNDSSVFRRTVGNVVTNLNEKYQKKAALVGSPRVLITANNPNAMRIREELNRHDLDAVRLRLGYVRVDGADDPNTPPPAAMELRILAAEAGFESAKEFTNAWVAGGGLARHVLWLNANRKVVPGHRLAVEGWASELTERLAVSVGSAGNVAHAVASGIVHGYRGAALHVEGDVVYVNHSHLATEWELVVGNRADHCPSPAGRISACKALSGVEEGQRRRVLRAGKQVQERFWPVPVARLARLADEMGLCTAEEFATLCAERAAQHTKAQAVQAAATNTTDIL